MKYSLFLLLLVGFGTLLAQPTITYAEWFMDTDPGYGNATPFQGFTPGDSVAMTATLSPASWPVGLHVVHARVQNSDLTWSHTVARPLLILPQYRSKINQVEYFWDTDPGYGNGLPPTVTFAPDDSLAVSWNIDLNTLEPGIHQLYLRTRNESGLWSQTVPRNVVVYAEPEALIEKIEYYFKWAPDSQTIAYTYPLAQPLQYVDVSFDPVITELTDSTTYTLCFTAITTDDTRSFEQCANIVWQGDTTTDSMTTHVNPAPEPSRWKLFPNPTQDFVYVQVPPAQQLPALITLASANGQTLSRTRVPASQDQAVQVDLRAYPAGIYLLVIEQGGQVHAFRVKRE